MSMREGFNMEAMEEKIKKNLDAGFTLEDIKIKLREELIANLKEVRNIEARNLELTDQMEYMDRIYGNPH